MANTNWYECISAAMKEHDETWNDIEHKTKFDPFQIFDSSYGSSQGPIFTVWTKNRVYFPAVYDGAEWCASVPRHPCEEATEHVGGE